MGSLLEAWAELHSETSQGQPVVEFHSGKALEAWWEVRRRQPRLRECLYHAKRD